MGSAKKESMRRGKYRGKPASAMATVVRVESEDHFRDVRKMVVLDGAGLDLVTRLSILRLMDAPPRFPGRISLHPFM